MLLLLSAVCRIFPILYAIAKPWLDPVTRAKVIRRACAVWLTRRLTRVRLQIVVVKGDIKETMLKDFDADQLPAGTRQLLVGSCRSRFAGLA